jgi:hypothetical protein
MNRSTYQVKPFYLSSETVLPFKFNLYRYIKKVSNDGRRLLPNVRYNIPAYKVLNQNMLSGGPWKEFLSYHTSPAFYDEVADLFAEAIRRFRPDLVGLCPLN